MPAVRHFAVVLGENELAQGMVGVKPLRSASVESTGQKNEQATVPVEDLTEFLINAMVATADDSAD